MTSTDTSDAKSLGIVYVEPDVMKMVFDRSIVTVADLVSEFVPSVHVTE